MNKKIDLRYEDLNNELNGGLELGSLTIIGGRPAIGKTTFAYNLLINNITDDTYGAFFTRESNIDKVLNDLKNISKKDEVSVYLCDDVLSLEEEMLEIKVLKKLNNKLNLVIIDYLELHNENREKVIDKLKILATKLNISIVLLSQLSRSIENRSNKRPMVDDLKLKDLNSIDNILLLYRESYYNDEISNDLVDLLEVQIYKNKNIYLEYDKNNKVIKDYKGNK